MPLDATYRSNERFPGTKYVILEIVAFGGMSEVYRARHEFTGDLVIIKVLHLHLRQSSAAARRLQEEARILVELRHANIVSVIDGGFTSDAHALPYLVMQALRGRTVQQTLAADGPFPVASVCALGAEVCAALLHAHDRHVIHGDVKPDNIFVHRLDDGRSTAILLDFGIFLRVRPGAEEGVYAVLGTPAYSSPEHLAGEQVTFKADVFALGLVLYEMLTGVLPFRATHEDALLEAYRTTRPLPPSARAPVPAPLDRLILAMLEPDPARRPQDCFVVRAALNEVTRLLGPGPRDDGDGVRRTRSSRPPVAFEVSTSQGSGEGGPGTEPSALPVITMPLQRASSLRAPVLTDRIVVLGEHVLKPWEVRRTRPMPGRPGARRAPVLHSETDPGIGPSVMTPVDPASAESRLTATAHDASGVAARIDAASLARPPRNAITDPTATEDLPGARRAGWPTRPRRSAFPFAGLLAGTGSALVVLVTGVWLVERFDGPSGTRAPARATAHDAEASARARPVAAPSVVLRARDTAVAEPLVPAASVAPEPRDAPLPKSATAPAVREPRPRGPSVRVASGTDDPKGKAAADARGDAGPRRVPPGFEDLKSTP